MQDKKQQCFSDFFNESFKDYAKSAILGTMLTTMTLNSQGADSRGFKNNNPGNIRKSNITWQGKIGDDGSFVTFKTMDYGVRALARILKTYHKNYNLNTINGIITRYAPPKENNTKRYIEFVSRETGINKNTALNLNDSTVMEKIINAIIKFENGKSISLDIIKSGIQKEKHE